MPKYIKSRLTFIRHGVRQKVVSELVEGKFCKHVDWR